MDDELLLKNYGWPNRPCERCSDHPGCHNYGCQIKAAWAAKYRETYGQVSLDRYQYPHSDTKVRQWEMEAAHDAAVAKRARDRYERKWIRTGAAIWLNGGISLDTIVEMLQTGVLKSMPRDTVKGKIRERIASVSRRGQG